LIDECRGEVNFESVQIREKAMKDSVTDDISLKSSKPVFLSDTEENIVDLKERLQDLEQLTSTVLNLILKQLTVLTKEVNWLTVTVEVTSLIPED